MLKCATKVHVPKKTNTGPDGTINNLAPSKKIGKGDKTPKKSSTKDEMANTNYTLAEYIWIDAVGGLRSKTKVIPGKKGVTLADLSQWNYDGSSTGQAPGTDSEVIIKPCAVFHDPFRGAPHVLVMTDTYTPKGEPIPTNSRAPAKKLFDAKPGQEPWFGIEQEYTMFKDGVPLGWPKSHARAGTNFGPQWTMGYPGPQGPYYCSIGADVAFGRDIVEEHMIACLAAGIQISGTNAEVMPGQWEYQVGPAVGISAADQMWVSRYIMLRVSEKYGVTISLDPKPIPGDWNGAGAHHNFSTKATRDVDGAMDSVIIPMLKKLEARHKDHLKFYGEGNERRLTGHHETASMEKFSWGIASRNTSVRVGNETAQNGKGYFEDRRPASNCDPYKTTSAIFATCHDIPWSP